MAIATGQITLVDLTDSINLQGFLTSSQSKMQFADKDGKNHNPNWGSNNVVITAELNEVGKAGNLINNAMVQNIKWYYKLGTGARTEITATGNGFTLGQTATKSPTLTITANKMTKANPTLTIECEINYKYNASFPVQTYKLSIDYSLAIQGNTGNTGATGSTGITTLLSKENANVPCNQSGTPNSGWQTLTESEVIVYQGASKLTAVATGTADASLSAKQFKITLGSGTGCTGELVGTSSSPAVHNKFRLSAVSADTGVLPVTITLKDEKGAIQTITKNFTFVKSKAGVNAKNLVLTSSGDVFTLNDKKTTATPGSITLTATPQNLGSSTYTWTYGVDGAAPTTTLDGTGATQTITWGSGSFAKSSKSVTYKVTCDGVSQTITLAAVSDGYSPVLADATTPNGYIFRNEEIPSLDCKLTLYRNGAPLSSGVAYKWYVASPGATDDQADVGAGWAAITNSQGNVTGAATQTLTVYSNTVLNVETFKCRATYDGSKYYGTVSLMDLTDPFTTEMYCPKGTTFKNGVGSTTITCKVYQNGTEVDTDGTKYNYNWVLYDKNGSQVSGKSWATKTVTINASDITETGTVRCVVSEKTKAAYAWV